MKKVLIRVSLLLCIAAALLLVCLAGVHLYLGTEPGARRLTSILNTLYPGTITGRTIEVSLLHQEVSITDFRLLGADGKTIIRADRAYLAIDLPALAKKEVILRTIRLVRPQCILSIDADGSLNIETAFSEKTSTEVSPFNLYIGKLTCEHGSLVFLLPDGEELVRLKDLQLTMDAAFTNDILIHLKVPSTELTLTVAGKSIDFGTSSVAGTINNDRIEKILIASKKASSRVTLSGSVVDLAKKGQLHWALDLDADLADFRKDLGMKDSASGRIAGRITAQGDYDNPGLQCALDYSGGSLNGPAIGKARLKGSMSDRVFICDEVLAHTAGGTITAKGTVDLRQVFPDGYFEGIKNDDAVSYALAVVGEGLDISKLPGLPKGMKGMLGADMAVKGQGLSPDTLNVTASSLRGRLSRLTAGDLLKDVDLDFEGGLAYRKGTLKLDPLVTRTMDATLTTRGTVALNSGAMAGTLELNTHEMTKLLALWGINGRGTLNATAALSGTLTRPAAEISLEGEGWALEGVNLGSVNLSGTLDQAGTLSVERCTVQNRASLVNASGSAGLFRDFPHMNPDPPVTVEADLTSVSLDDFTTDIPLTGLFSGRMNVSGSASSLTADMNLKGSGVGLADVALGEVRLEAMLKDGLLTVARLGLTKGRSSLTALGTAQILDQRRFALVPDPGIDLRITEGSIFLQDVSDAAKGTVSVTGDIRGTLGHPVGNLSLSGASLDLGIQKLSEVKIAARLDGEKMWFDPITLTVVPGQGIQGTGWLSLDGEYSLAASSAGIPLAAVDFLKERDGLQGTAVIDVAGKGNIAHPQISGKLLLKDIVFNEKPFQECSLTFDLKDRELTYAGNLNFAVQGNYSLVTRDYQASAVFDRTDLSPYFTFTGKPQLSGTITGNLSVSGKAGNLDTIELSADLAAMDILLEGKKLVLANNVVVSYQDGRLSIPRTHVQLAEIGWLDVTGSGSLKDSLMLNAEGDIPVEVLGPFVEGLSDGVGLIRLSTNIRTRGTKPEITSRVTLVGVGYTIPYNGQRIHDTNGSIRIEDSKVFIDDVTGRIDTGYFTLGGTAVLDGYTPREADLKAQAKALPIVIPDSMDLTVDTDMALSASKGQALLKSDVIILDGIYYKDVKVNILTGVIERIIPRPRQTVQQAGTSPFMKNTALDVSIIRRGSVTVENNIARLDINPDLMITGTLQEPIVTGRLAVTEGTMTYQGNEFTVTRGIIDFLNPYRTEATVDIKGKTTVRDWTITLSLEGSLDNLLLQLSSTPPEEQPDLLSLLIVGKTTRELTQTQSGVGVSPSGMIAELLTSTYGEQVKKATTLDILKIETSEFSTADQGDTLKLTVGKELSRRMTISYEMETRNTETIQRGIAEYKLLENLLINGYQGSNGIFGADVEYRYEFR
ncbi:MAG: translocation/assembly module TamB domain-containing protein [Syntrophaceae bacterium]